MTDKNEDIFGRVAARFVSLTESGIADTVTDIHDGLTLGWWLAQRSPEWFMAAGRDCTAGFDPRLKPVIDAVVADLLETCPIEAQVP